MDWTSKAPSHWEWEALFPFNEKEAEISKLAQQPELKFDHTNNSYMIGSESGGDACSSIDYGNGSSRSSISVSIGSPSKASPSKASPSHAVAITRVFNFESVEQSPQDLNKNRDLANLEAAILDEAAVSIAPTEQLIGLKLGKRTYFEDICGATSIANTSLASTNSLTGLVKKVKVPQQNMQSSCCQVEGCNIDLTSAKDYHRKHRVCETHSKSPRVIVAGQERRFCQQCSRFHGLSEFDQKKRSCRRRLSDHNARRRKPQPETMSFSSSIFPASYFDVKQPASLSFGRAPFNQLINIGSSPWNDSGGFKLVPAKESRVNSSKLESINRHLHLPSIEMPKNISTVSHDLDWLLPFKGVAAKVVDNKGLGAPVAVSFSDGASDLRRALSLLSSEVWASPDLEPVSDFQFANENTIGTHSANHPSNAAISVWQQDELPLPKALPFNLQTSDAHFQELQLHKATPCKTTFFDSTRIH